ncbi:autotransporter secretion inner membrane protein TamB [Yoonia rosea]|uniref:Autotransporter secretion inner membrane protein TamB n=1 Tax=Yoonia rosea TaxID=287098 RepID=A0A1R3X8Z8_9RHOB|nr:translocation/assembly module TamB domain-containing protein [Yoonia rosea]SIT87360.1 autotransporter secretion inner membrane protein TamB [Yoonia rosea]
MKRFLIIGALCAAPFTASAQEDDDEGYLAGLIEENLSGVSRQVNIQGFEGALSSEATIDVLTIADAEGVWLTLEDIVLNWRRTALLRGVIDVSELSAARIIVSRPPLSENTGPAPEAQPFSLPELPVSVSLDQLRIDSVELGEAFLGEPITVSLNGSAQLADGEGTVALNAERLGDKSGVFEINGSFVNETRLLDLFLNLDEGPDGIVARLIDLPGRPAVKLEVAGAAPLDDYAATLAIATDGQDRLTGNFGLSSAGDARRISLDIGGDISPLFLPEYQGFFGNDASLSAQVVQAADGRIDVQQLALDAGRVALIGAVQIDSAGWPAVIDLNGGITALDNDPVLLPLSGPRTFVDGMDLAISYDAAVADTWRADISVAGLERPGLGIDTLRLQGGGLLRSGEGAQQGLFTADLAYGATGLQLDDAGAAQAFGDEIGGEFNASRVEGAPIEITRFTLGGAGLDAQAQATIEGADAGFRTNATMNVGIAGLGRFSTLAGRDIGGAAELAVLANMTPLDGLFNFVVSGETSDLSVDIPEADRILAGTGTFAATAVRDTEGTRLEGLRVNTDAASIRASAALTSDGADARINASLRDVALVLPALSGPAAVAGDVTRRADGRIEFALSGTGPAATFETSGTVNPAETGQTLNAALAAEISDLTRYAGLAGRPLAGALSVEGNGVLLADGQRFDVDVRGETRDLVTGVARVDPLLSGDGSFTAALSHVGAGRFGIGDLLVQTPAMSLRGDADVSLTGANTADLSFRIDDAALLDPSLSGPVTVDLTAVPAPMDATDVTLRASGPGTDVGLTATVASPENAREVTGDLDLQVESLGAFATLIGQPLAGSVDLTASGSLLPDLTRFDTQVNLRSEDLRIGNPTADALLAGTGRINATVSFADEVLAVRTLEVSTRELSVVGALNGAAGFGQGRFNASLRDVGILTDQISGPIRARGSASLDENGTWGIDATGTGPGGLNAQIVGDVSQNGTLAIDVDGSAPLALANTAIDPRRLSGLANFDLSVNGPPALSSLAGQITFSDGRLAAPNLGEALTDIAGGISMANGSAQIDLRTRVESGGSISISGPVALTAPNQADITVALNDMVLQDPDLYSSRVAGAINLTGPLSGGARISGRLQLGETNVQVPSSSISSLGDLPDVRHVDASAAVRRTLQRAGVVNGNGSQNAGTGGSGPAFPLDIVINAPSRIFIRGRGLDAELGGSLTIGGTSNDVIPVGRFELIRGRIDILQQRFELDEGTATLQGDFAPFLRLVATTETDTGTVISIVVEGPAGAPEVSFLSVPELPQDEVLSQLIFGRDLESISPLQAVQLASAISTLAGRGGGALDSFRQRVGLDDFDVTTDDEGNAAVRAGAYVSENVYTDVTVTSTGETEINLNLDVTSEVTAKGSVNQAGDTSIGLFYERDY